MTGYNAGDPRSPERDSREARSPSPIGYTAPAYRPTDPTSPVTKAGPSRRLCLVGVGGRLLLGDSAREAAMQGNDERDSPTTRLAVLMLGALAAGVEIPDTVVAVALLAAVVMSIQQ
jgi:hypothetical protein